MALSVGATWGVASVAAAMTFAIGTMIVIFFVRRRHHQLLLPASGLARRLSTYHRTHLSVDGTNYAQIPHPRTQLRRSAHLPYGVISEGWADLHSQESIGRPPMAVILEQQGIEPELAQPKRRRSLRATFSPHSFHVPKTRRQKKIDKAIPMNAVGRSPLSAITEISDPNTRDVSPAVGAVELPTEITPTTTPPRPGDVLKATRPISAQWPLQNDKRRSQDVLPAATGFGVDRNSAMLRMNSIGHSTGPSRVSLGQRSISMASNISVAPDDPLPPLPTIVAAQYPQRSNSKVRSSMASTDTISSSVLGTGIFSHDGTDQTDFTLESPRVALSPSLLREYESRPESWGHTAVTMGTPPGTKASRGLRVGAAGVGSFRASIGNPLSRMTSTSQPPTSNHHENRIDLAGSVLKTIDASGWDGGSTDSANSFRTSLSPSLPALFTRHDLTYRDGKPAERHSMYEQYTGIGKISFNPDVLQHFPGNNISPLLRPPQPRPASVGTTNPFQWDHNVLSALRDANLNQSRSSQSRGHKRQVCVRISNLPSADLGRRGSKLPQMAEEDEQPETPTRRSSNIPGLHLIQDGDKNIIYKPVPQEGPPSPSPFRNRPILMPTSGMTYSRAIVRESSGSPLPDSDVFSTDHYDPKAANIFASRSPNRNWPLSPTPLKNIKLNSTPSTTLNTLLEPYDPESPILPSPTLLSATLFPRKSMLHGPRNLPSTASSGRSSRNASPSPLQRMSRHANTTSATAAKPRSGDELRRSVMKLRRMNSDLNHGSQDRVSKIYRNMANEYGGSLGSVRSRSPSMVAATGSASPVLEKHVENLAPWALIAGNRLTSTPSVGNGAGVRHSNSRMAMGHSVSMISTTGASIWEDASVRGDSPEPELPVLEERDNETPKAKAMVDLDLEAYENYGAQDRRDRARESKLTSPRGQGLGLMGLGSQVWGTPASLYDRDGFLKE